MTATQANDATIDSSLRTARRKRGLIVAAPWFAVVITFAVGAIAIPGFGEPKSIGSLLTLAAFLGIAATGQTTVILLGGIDLSLASTIGLGEVITSIRSAQHDSFVGTVAILLGLGIVVGIINGGVTGWARVHPLVVTLGTSFVIEGAVLVWTNGGQGAGTAPAFLNQLEQSSIKLGPVDFAPVVVVWIVWCLIGWLLERRTVVGRQLYALGSSERAAVLALGRRRITWIAAFIFSALSGEAAGVLLSGFSGGADFGVGSSYLFTAITAVVVGGTSLLGGSGGAWRTLAGVLLVTIIQTVLVGIGFDPNAQEALLGAFILVVVAIIGREAHLRSRI